MLSENLWNKPMHCLLSPSATNYKLIVHSCNKKQDKGLLQYRLRLSDNGPNMQNCMLCIYIPLYPAFEETKCVLWDAGVVVTAHWRGRQGARMTFLQGGPKFEVTPLNKINNTQDLTTRQTNFSFFTLPLSQTIHKVTTSLTIVTKFTV